MAGVLLAAGRAVRIRGASRVAAPEVKSWPRAAASSFFSRSISFWRFGRSSWRPSSSTEVIMYAAK